MHEAQLSQFIEDETSKGNFVPEDYFDSACITPATEFMWEAGIQTQRYIREKLEQTLWKQVRIVYSGSNTPGEGEHKIMQFLRRAQDHPEQRICIYSPDADMLLLGLVTHLPYVLILREAARRNDDLPTRGFTGSKPEFDLIFLSVIREYFSLEFPELDLERLVDDFVLMVTFVGNDFVPTIPTFDINEGGLNYLLDAYKSLHRYLSSAGKIDWNALNEFMATFRTHEQLVLEKRIKGQEQTNTKPGAAGHRKLFEMSKNRPEESTSGEHLEKIKEIYYQECFKIQIQDPKAQEKVGNYVKAYLEGIQWVMHYYYRGCRDWDWFYPQHYAPMLSDFTDIERLMELDSEGEVVFRDNAPYQHLEQLLIAIPPQAAILIPEEYRIIFQDPLLADQFPKAVAIEHDLLSAKATWSSVKVLLPFADRTRIREAIRQIEPSEATKTMVSEAPEVAFFWTETGLTEIEVQWQEERPFGAIVVNEKQDPKDFPSLSSIPGTITVSSGSESGYMEDYRLPTVRYRISQQSDSSAIDSLIGQVIFIGFPFKFPGKVEFISSKSTIYPQDSAAHFGFSASSDYHSRALRLRRDLSKTLSQEQGIEIAPELNVLLHVRKVVGYKKTLLGNKEYEFDNRVIEVPLELSQVIAPGWVDPDLITTSELLQEFPIDSTVVLLEQEDFGCIGKVTGQEVDHFYEKGSLKVRVAARPKLQLCARMQTITKEFQVQYHRLQVLAKEIGVPVSLLSRFTQSIVVSDMQGDRVKKFELGLNLRKDKERLCVPGATRWAYLWDQETTEWEFSEEVAKDLKEYWRLFPELWESVNKSSPGIKIYYARELFGYVNQYWVEMRKVGLWLMSRKSYRKKWASIKSQEAPEELIERFQSALGDAVTDLSDATLVINPGMVYRPDRPLTPRFMLKSQCFTLGDRVRVLMEEECQSVTFGSEGTVIGTYNNTDVAVLMDTQTRNSALRNPIVTVPGKFLLNLSDQILGVNRGPKDYQGIDFQTGSTFKPAFAERRVEKEASLSRAVINTSAPVGDFKIIKGEDGLPITLKLDYPEDLEKFEFDYPDPIDSEAKSIDVQLPAGFTCRILFDFVNK